MSSEDETDGEDDNTSVRSVKSVGSVQSSTSVRSGDAKSTKSTDTPTNSQEQNTACTSKAKNSKTLPPLPSLKSVDAAHAIEINTDDECEKEKPTRTPKKLVRPKGKKHLTQSEEKLMKVMTAAFQRDLNDLNKITESPEKKELDDVAVFTEHIGRQLRQITDKKKRLFVQHEIQNTIFNYQVCFWEEESEATFMPVQGATRPFSYASHPSNYTPYTTSSTYGQPEPYASAGTQPAQGHTTQEKTPQHSCEGDVAPVFSQPEAGAIVKQRGRGRGRPASTQQKTFAHMTNVPFKVPKMTLRSKSSTTSTSSSIPSEKEIPFENI